MTPLHVLTYTSTVLTVLYGLGILALVVTPLRRWRRMAWPALISASLLLAALHATQAWLGAGWGEWVVGGIWLLVAAAQYATWLYIRYVDRRIAALRQITAARPRPARRTLEGPPR